MSIWGKIGGAAAGMLVGGPVGAALGALAGHFLIDRGEDSDPGVVFTIAVIALSAKMAKADGVVTDDEVEAFDRIFRVPPDERASVRRFFNLARQDTAGYEAYATQVARIFAGKPAVLEDIMDGLFEIAAADGVLHPGESVFLERVAEIFGFAPGEFRRIRASHFPPDAADPYVVLGVAFDAGDDEIKRTYYRLVRENHPDSLIARGVPPEFVKLASDKLAAINGAYEKIQAERH
ncbi:MAG: TerB family tellurite resistance protein [Alphaproteobacteria bacterium]|nr:TerB family tellurite resistance protein [Alphaproteobacteria bacterium]MDE1987096.1 TerB family tellurite resistance protein [Alphaproteobacteria bacterium]MDE2163759.1 TerB family tellurite resistance protein [Alphaproteobacteria bacterium]MDE2266604.1 TerB family tellurite resistance protein [Alphaproteobacteria bacterium]